MVACIRNIFLAYLANDIVYLRTDTIYENNCLHLMQGRTEKARNLLPIPKYGIRLPVFLVYIAKVWIEADIERILRQIRLG